MRKLLVFLAILFVSVMSSACINNLAIQELNTKAKEYLDKGDYDEAIKRLESSVDLDGSVVETRYNLAVAYVNKEHYKKAIAQLDEAEKLDPVNADIYYTKGVALEGEAFKKLETPSVEGENQEDEAQEVSLLQQAPRNEEEAQFVCDKLNEAIAAYEKYLEIAQNPADLEKVKAHIEELKEKTTDFSKNNVSNSGAGDDDK